MKAAVVLVVGDFESLNEAYGLDYAFHALSRQKLSAPYHVLIAEGFENIPADFVGRWRERNILIEDAAPVFASLVQDYPYLEALPQNPTHRVTLLRHILLERVFAGEPVLSVDVDVVWRTDPYRLFEGWDGGFFALGDSGFLTWAADKAWFDAYRLGLESALTGGSLTADFREAKFGITKVLHDQHLFRHLEAKGLMHNAWDACRTAPALRSMALVSNPLYPKTALLEPPDRLSLEQDEAGERLGGAEVAFWHMQTSFVMLCAFFFLAGALTNDHEGRLPFPRPKAGRDNLKAALLHQLRHLVVTGQVTDPRFTRLRPMMFRRGVYKAFFQGLVAPELFTDRLWWEPGVFR
jgi:hypothetical protein